MSDHLPILVLMPLLLGTPLVPALGIGYRLGVDGLSLLLLAGGLGAYAGVSQTRKRRAGHLTSTSSSRLPL